MKLKQIIALTVFLALGLGGMIFLGNNHEAREVGALQEELLRQESLQAYLSGRQEYLADAIEKARLRLSQRNEEAGRLNAEMDGAQALAGLTKKEGAGVVLTLSDAPREEIIPNVDISFFLVHDEDLLYLVNELRAAGAGAISINGERILAGSPILCRGPSIFISGLSFTPPYEVSAVGDQAKLLNASREAALHFLGISYSIRAEDHLSIPPGQRSEKPGFAKSLEEG